MSKHTPTPWYATGWNVGARFICKLRGPLPIVCKCEGATSAEKEANARHIVKCVNAHDELVAEVDRLNRELLEEKEFIGAIQIRTLMAERDHAVLCAKHHDELVDVLSQMVKWDRSHGEGGDVQPSQLIYMAEDVLAKLKGDNT